MRFWSSGVTVGSPRETLINCDLSESVNTSAPANPLPSFLSLLFSLLTWVGRGKRILKTLTYWQSLKMSPLLYSQLNSSTLDSPKNVLHIPPAACWIPNWFLGTSQEKRVVFLWKRCDVAPVAGRQLVPSLCRTPDHSKSLIEAFLKSNPGDELFWTRHCPGGERWKWSCSQNRGGEGEGASHFWRIISTTLKICPIWWAL